MKNKRLNIKYYELLARRIRQKDTAAFTELYNATYPDFFRYACYILKDHHLAQDALQEIYISIYKNIASLKEDRLLYPWMRQITYHVCCDLLRRSSNISRHEGVDLSEWQDAGNSLFSVEDSLREVFDNDLYEHMSAWLSELPYHVRTAFTLRHINGLKLEEIADFMDCSLSSVKRYIKTARTHLQKRMKEYQR